MNRRFVFGAVFVAMALCAAPAWAQTTSGQVKAGDVSSGGHGSVGGGIKFGVNLATLGGFNEPGLSTSQRTGLVAGVFLTVGMAPLVSFQPEVLYSMQGSKLTFTSGGISTDATAKLDYLQVPLLLRIGNNGKAGATLYGLVGPSFGLLMRADQNGENIKNSLNDVDMGVVVGAGVSLSRFLVEGRYTIGLKDLNKVPEPGSTTKNRVISIFIGLVF
jgi:hypothetical protein